MPQATKPKPASAPRPRKVARAPVAAPPVKGKIAALIDLLRQEDGATIETMMATTGWQAHSVRGAISGAIKKSRGLNVLSEKTEAGRVYRIVGEATA